MAIFKRISDILKSNINDLLDKAEDPEKMVKQLIIEMEEQLDDVAEGKLPWKEILRRYWPTLREEVRKAQAELDHVSIADEETDVICEKCGRHMVIKYGPHGKFLACPGFPECRNTKPYLERIGVACPLCGKDVVRKKTRKGRVYYGCENNPDCDFMVWNRPVAQKCPNCGGVLLQKGNKLVCNDEKCGYVTERKDED